MRSLVFRWPTVAAIAVLCLTGPVFAYAPNDQPPGLALDTLQAQYGLIRYASLIFRHGDRTPVMLYPTDPYQNYAWPVDLGELTNDGKRREYALGKYFEPRYNCLTGEVYLPTRVIMQSVDVDRCLMSGQLFFAGYFPPFGSEVWNDKLLWQPIPVHTTPVEYDYVIEGSKSCPVRDLAIANFYATNPLILTICTNFADMFLYIANYTGLNMSNCATQQTINNLLVVQDTLLVESQLGLALPDWATAVFPEPLSYLRAVLMNIEVEDPIVAKFTAGPLLNVIASDMLNMANLPNTLPQGLYSSNASETPPLHLFSGHDSTIVTLMRALNMYQNITPPYGAALGFELRSRDNSYYVTAVYEYTLLEPLQVLQIPGCLGGCTLANFLALLAPFLPVDWDAECQGVVTTATTLPVTLSTIWTGPPTTVLPTLPTGWTRPPRPPNSVIVVSNPLWDVPWTEPKRALVNGTRLERVHGTPNSTSWRVRFDSALHGHAHSYASRSDSFRQAGGSPPNSTSFSGTWTRTRNPSSESGAATPTLAPATTAAYGSRSR